MKFAICDDCIESQNELRDILDSFKSEIPITLIEAYSSGDDLYAQYKDNGRYDVIFLDIEMPGMSGLATGHEIRKIDKDVMIIFLTNYERFMGASFEICTFDYIKKPPDVDRLHSVLIRATKNYQELHHRLQIKLKDKLLELEVNEIIYIEYHERYVHFYTTINEEPYKCAGKLIDYKKKLIPYGFLECHKSILINMNYIRSIESESIETKTNVHVRMSIKNKSYYLKKFKEYSMRYLI
ncbi:MAG: LytTR family DNA-binding domain-containing protein [Firmicutes bacterium]|nr:LytTR family DNA-binding domain-containing protein [Bacillota bacterium]